MNLIIFEDNLIFARKLEAYIKKMFGYFITSITVSDSFSCVIASARQSLSHSIYLLDILIHEKEEGLKAAQELHHINPNNKIIFMTRFPEKILYSTESKLHAINFIVKRHYTFLDELKNTLNYIINCELCDTLLIYSDNYSEIRVAVKDIFYIETIPKSHKIKIIHTKGYFEIRVSLNDVIKQLNSRFACCHNSYIVNVDKIMEVKHKNRELIMENGHICYYSYLKAERLLKAVRESKL